MRGHRRAQEDSVNESDGEQAAEALFESEVPARATRGGEGAEQ